MMDTPIEPPPGATYVPPRMMAGPQPVYGHAERIHDLEVARKLDTDTLVRVLDRLEAVERSAVLSEGWWPRILERVEALEKRLDAFERRCDNFEKRANDAVMRLERRVAALEHHASDALQRLDGLEHRVLTGTAALKGKLEKGKLGHMLLLEVGDRVVKVTFEDA